MDRGADVLTLARQRPARFDVAARASFPPLRRGRLAHLIRQDLWRALQSLRGFSPVVRIATVPGGLMVTAGGRVTGPVAPTVQRRIAVLLEDPERRARWITNAHLGDPAV